MDSHDLTAQHAPHEPAEEFAPNTIEQADCARRIYNGIKSRHIACLVAGAVMHALQDPAFIAKSTDIDIGNLKVLFED